MAVTDVTSELVASYKLTVTGLLATTCPVRVPSGKAVAVAVGDPSGVDVAVSDPFGVCVAVAVDDPSGVDVAVSDPFGVCVAVAVDDPSGVDVAVSDPLGVDDGIGVSVGVEVSGVTDPVGVDVNVNVGVPRIIVRVAAPVEGKEVRLPSPIETRAVQSIEVSATCPKDTPKAVTLNVKAVPLVVALLPLLPAIAKTKLPLCELLNAVAGSVPNKPAAAMLLTATKFASYVQVNSALV